ncbi:hypothetical protein [Pseudolabrys sp. FHR47]|uniref:hypothetical protein n=1 Tax=Pseudolabrys sp. FHR47 TaxID=2562284 RepID=UPI001FF001AB|nr:hypothetical protein [Pseudolabrys sp. FHR47]
MVYPSADADRSILSGLRALPAHVAWPLVVAALLYVLLLALGGKLLNDADTYWQIALGDWMIAHRTVPHVDTFSWTLPGAPWISSQWLAQVIFAVAYGALGWSGVVAVSALAIASAFGLLTYYLMRHLAPMPALALVMAGFVLAAPHMVARPHALALPVMVMWVAGLVRAADEKRTPSYWLLPLIALWANLHGGFTFGLMLIAPLALEALINARADERLYIFMRWALFGIAALAAACVTPYGPESILVTRRILGLGPALALIGEWQPQDFARLGGFELVLLGALGLLLWRRVTLPPVRILVVLGLVHMALSQSRSGEMLGLVAPLFMAAPLAPQFGRHTISDARPLYTAAAAALLLLAAAMSIVLPLSLRYEPRAEVSPTSAVEAVKASGRTRLLNSYDFGGYLIAQGVKPFIDGRTELYGAEFFLRHDAAVNLKNVGVFYDLMRDRDIDVTMLAPSTPAVGLLDRMPEWKRVYADGIAVVHVRVGG